METNSADRNTDIVLRNIEEWRKKLLDLSGRNSLISLFGKKRTLVVLKYPGSDGILEQLLAQKSMEFCLKSWLLDDEESDEESEPEEDSGVPESGSRPPEGEKNVLAADARMEETWRRLMSSPKLCPTHILTEWSDTQLEKKLRTLESRASESLSEQGIQTLYLAIGTLKWRESPDSEKWMTAPLLLVPVQLLRGGFASQWMLSPIEDEVRSNETLQERLRGDFGIELPASPFDVETGSTTDQWQAWLTAVREKISSHSSCDGWEVTDEAVLGTFRFDKLPIWHDLGNHAGLIAEHPICRALGGDSSRLEKCVSGIGSLESEDTDRTVSPEDLHTILDCDSSQLKAILAVRRVPAKARRSPISSRRRSRMVIPYFSSAKRVWRWKWCWTG